MKHFSYLQKKKKRKRAYIKLLTIMKCKYDIEKHDDFHFTILSNNGRAFFSIVTFFYFLRWNAL